MDACAIDPNSCAYVHAVRCEMGWWNASFLHHGENIEQRTWIVNHPGSNEMLLEEWQAFKAACGDLEIVLACVEDEKGVPITSESSLNLGILTVNLASILQDDFATLGEWLAGPITSLVTDAEHCALKDVDVEDTVHLITRHGTVMGSYSINQHQHPNECRITVICDSGAARFELSGHRWLTASEPGGEWRLEGEFKVDRDSAYIRQANRFLDQIDGKDGPTCSLDEGIQTLKVNLAALHSWKTRQWVDI